MHQRENRGVRADSQGNRKNDGQGKSGRLVELTERDEDVVHEMLSQIFELVSQYAAARPLVQFMHIIGY
jgi:hypothetical protein